MKFCSLPWFRDCGKKEKLLVKNEIGFIENLGLTVATTLVHFARWGKTCKFFHFDTTCHPTPRNLVPAPSIFRNIESGTNENHSWPRINVAF